MALLSKVTYRCSTIPAKIPTRSFIDIEKIILICILKIKRNIIAKTILKKKNKVGDITTQFQDPLYSYSNQDCGIIGGGINT